MVKAPHERWLDPESALKEQHEAYRSAKAELTKCFDRLPKQHSLILETHLSRECKDEQELSHYRHMADVNAFEESSAEFSNETHTRLEALQRSAYDNAHSFTKALNDFTRDSSQLFEEIKLQAAKLMTAFSEIGYLEQQLHPEKSRSWLEEMQKRAVGSSTEISLR